MNEPKFTELPLVSMALSHASNPRGPSNRRNRVSACGARRCAPLAATTWSLTGALVVPSPMISVVMPWVTLEITRPSPSKSAPRE